MNSGSQEWGKWWSGHARSCGVPHGCVPMPASGGRAEAHGANEVAVRAIQGNAPKGKSP